MNYVGKLTASFRNTVRLRTPVAEIRRNGDGVEIRTPAGPPECFAAVVLACHADQALSMLRDPTPLEEELLSAFPYAANSAILHSDRRLMPRRRAAWASWNFHKFGNEQDKVALTYHMNRLQRLSAHNDYFVTLNRDAAVAADSVHARFVYEHPQYDARGVALQARHDELNGRNHTYYCGAYWGYGFHEDGVASALRVAERFGERL
jgi:predicted NAD/FAD-binding protein